MLSVVQLARVVTGSVLIIVGLIAIPLPLTPGIPLVILGASIGLTWHPKGATPVEALAGESRTEVARVARAQRARGRLKGEW